MRMNLDFFFLTFSKTGKSHLLCIFKTFCFKFTKDISGEKFIYNCIDFAQNFTDLVLGCSCTFSYQTFSITFVHNSGGGDRTSGTARVLF